MFNADGHDQNCAIANDPRNACDCGGVTRQRAEYKPLNFDIADAMSNALGDMPRLAENITTVSQQVLANKDKMIRAAADKAFGVGNWEDKNMVASRQADGREIYSHAGKLFVELSAVKFDTVEQDDGYVIAVKQSYRMVEPG